MDDEVFARTVKLCVYQVHRVMELCGIDEIAAVGHPEGIACHVATDVDDGAAHSHFNFLNLVEDEQTQFLVEAIEHHHLVERSVRLVAVQLLGHLQEGIHIGRQTVVAYELEVSLSLSSVGYRQAARL